MSTIEERVKKIIGEQLGVKIPDEEAEKITTVQAAIDYINGHQA